MFIGTCSSKTARTNGIYTVNGRCTLDNWLGNDRHCSSRWSILAADRDIYGLDYCSTVTEPFATETAAGYRSRDASGEPYRRVSAELLRDIRCDEGPIDTRDFPLHKITHFFDIHIVAIKKCSAAPDFVLDQVSAPYFPIVSFSAS